VADENPFEQQAAERRATFKGRHGYPAQAQSAVERRAGEVRQVFGG
jgi:hypothetical protein